MVNQELRAKIEASRLKYWQVAQKAGISSGQFSVWLRTNLTEERKKRVEKAIDELTKQVKE